MCICVAELDNGFTLLLAIALRCTYYAMVRYTKLPKAKQVKLKVKGASEPMKGTREPMKGARERLKGKQHRLSQGYRHNCSPFLSITMAGYSNHNVINIEDCRSM